MSGAGLLRIALAHEAPADVLDGAGDRERDAAVAIELDEYFSGGRRAFTMPVDFAMVHSPFRRAVLERLRAEVGYGETVSYGELASMAGRPRAARAVGATMAANPVPIVIPCHRVVAAGGRLGGYGPSGLDTKRFLLRLEGLIF